MTAGSSLYITFTYFGSNVSATLKNGTPHSRYFSDELGVPIILIDTEQMFALQRDAWYNINVNIVYYLRKKNYFRR